MKCKKEYLYCDPQALVNISEIREIDECVAAVIWENHYRIDVSGQEHQTGYNKAFEVEFDKMVGWERQPRLFGQKKGDFQKSGVCVEVQFGHSSTIFRDYYKFHYLYKNSPLKLAVLIVPVNAKQFFPIRRSTSSVSGMAEFDFAYRHFKLLDIPVPILLIGLLPEN